MDDFPEIGSSWQKPVNDGESMDSRRIVKVVREAHPPQKSQSQNVWVYYADRHGEVSRAELQDWRRWVLKATKITDGVPVLEPQVVPVGSL